jgi:hypothetical protein
VVSFAAPSSLGKINQIKQNKYKNPDKTTEIIETNMKTYESDSRKSYRDACGFLEVHSS